LFWNSVDFSIRNHITPFASIAIENNAKTTRQTASGAGTGNMSKGLIEGAKWDDEKEILVDRKWFVTRMIGLSLPNVRCIEHGIDGLGNSTYPIRFGIQTSVYLHNCSINISQVWVSLTLWSSWVTRDNEFG
jgi:hypothetical protein